MCTEFELPLSLLVLVGCICVGSVLLGFFICKVMSKKSGKLELCESAEDILRREG